MLDSIGRHETPPTGPTAVAQAVAAGTTGRWLRAVSRVGMVSRAVVYLLVAYLTLRLVLASHPRATEPASGTGAVQQAAQGSWGRASLLLLAAGFASYALTQLVEAIFRPRHAGSTLKRWRQRMISTWGCLLYSAFCVCTISMLVASRRPAGTSQSEQRQDTALTAAVLRIGPGRLLLLVAGLLVVVAGAELGRRSIRLTFQERFITKLRAPLLGTTTRAVGAFGCLARGAVFILIGVFILKAAVTGDSRQIKGLDATFRSVARSTYGPIILSALALGLFSYGLYCLLEARYRDLTPGR